MRAKLGTLVKRVLRKYGYPPDKQKKATLEQAELLGKEWAAWENPVGKFDKKVLREQFKDWTPKE